MTSIYSTLVVLQWVAALILIMEAITKSHQCSILCKDITLGARLAMIAKALAWTLVAMAAAGVMIAPVLREIASPSFGPQWINPQPSVSECCLFIAFAMLVVRSWIIAALRHINPQWLARQAGETHAATGAR